MSWSMAERSLLKRDCKPTFNANQVSILPLVRAI